MRVLILGGTSFFGREIVREFVGNGHDVTLFTRGNQKPSDLPTVRRLLGDRYRAEDLRQATGHWDCVIDNIAYDADGVTTALSVLKDVGRYVLTSTVSVYRFTREQYPIPWRESCVDYDFSPPEEQPRDIHWKYARGKLEAEKTLRLQTTVPWTIVRPTVVYGPNDTKNRGFWYLDRMRRGGPILMANGGAASFRLVDSADVATGIRLAALSHKAVGRTYNLAQSEIITLEMFLRESARALGVKPELVSVPLADLGELGGPHGTLINCVPDIEASREIGFLPTPFPTFIERATQWFEDHWEGDTTELLRTRPQELAFAETWKRRLS